MNFATLKFEQKNALGILTIHRPESLNALSLQVLQELDQVLNMIESKKDLQCLVITGSGEKAFVAGADIKEINGLNLDTAKTFAENGQKVFLRIEKLKIPVIAAVNGFALGGGLELALSCDFIYCSQNAIFGLPEVTLGLIPGFGGTVRLSKVVGLSKAREMVFSGDMISAEEAFQKGLVNKVCAQSELMSDVMKKAESICSRSPLAVSAAKKAVLKAADLDLETAMKFEAQVFSELFNYEDVKEGTKAFIEKRKANFKGI